MQTFYSDVKDVGSVDLPAYTGLRVMMMPVRLEDPETVPWPEWRPAFERLVELAPVREGVGYLTIDEADLRAGECHRRPGLHVDGLGAWGGGGPWAARGMLLASSRIGCRAWRQEFKGAPGPDGDCEHLVDQLDPNAVVYMRRGRVYHCGPLAVHESLRPAVGGHRQVVRLSMPSDAPWFEGYTESPCGVLPTGPTLSRRAGMDYRPA